MTRKEEGERCWLPAEKEMVSPSWIGCFISCAFVGRLGEGLLGGCRERFVWTDKALVECLFREAVISFTDGNFGADHIKESKVA